MHLARAIAFCTFRVCIVLNHRQGNSTRDGMLNYLAPISETMPITICENDNSIYIAILARSQSFQLYLRP